MLGFKNSNQSQMLHDVIYYPDAFDAQPWLVLYISKPLIGTHQPLNTHYLGPQLHQNSIEHDDGPESNVPKKKEIKSFADLLNNFPIIARQMQPGLEDIFRKFSKDSEKPLPPTPPRIQGRIRRGSTVSSGESGKSNGHLARPQLLEPHGAEDVLRKSLESAVMAAIDLFQMVDKQQLSLLGSTTELTGPVVERMIERYVAEQMHDTILFPQLCAIRRAEDAHLELQMRHMTDVDISQVGISFRNAHECRDGLTLRLARAVAVFKTMGVAGSPQEMMEILLNTEKAISQELETPAANGGVAKDASTSDSEKESATFTINADTLVSLLLIVLIRTPIRHLFARLSYMRNFIFIDDVESGELGYALSTFEAVLSYLARDSATLRRSSRKNRRLWQAAKSGSVEGLKSVFEPECISFAGPDSDNTREHDSVVSRGGRRGSQEECGDPGGLVLENIIESISPNHIDGNGTLEPGPLTRVAPPEAHTLPDEEEWDQKIRKRVSVETLSTSSSSAVSYESLADTIGSGGGIADSDASTALAQTRGIRGESVVMMVVGSGNEEALEYLLGLSSYYPLDFILEDCDNDRTTLLSAAVQAGRPAVIDKLLGYILQHAPTNQAIAAYFARQDVQGRSVAHYLFNQPRLITRIGCLLPWRLKDKNGQTPLFGLCRSYDHEDYGWMVNAALSTAADAQGDYEPLHLEDHVDAKGNTLLHIANDPQVALLLLNDCDSDVNAANAKRFTPLMVASKYGRMDLVRILFGDPRVDLYAKDLRGLTAVELAKDDEVRNRMDDLVLLSAPPSADGRTTSVVRSLFVDDGTVRLILKSGLRNENATITVTTCRRSLSDFESLAAWLGIENPASWLPSVSNFPSPYLIPSKPSRAILRDIQIRLDKFLQALLSHSTFSTHEMVWEFFLVPELDPAMLADRTRKKAEIRAERVRDEYTPITEVRDVEVFVAHARDSILGVHHSTKSVIRRTNRLRLGQADLCDAMTIASPVLSALSFLPDSHVTAFYRFAKTFTPTESEPLSAFHYDMHAISTTITAVLKALLRPTALISSMSACQNTIDRYHLSMRRSDRWPLGLLDETRQKLQRDAAEKVDKTKRELETLGKELRYTQQTVVGELAAWQEERAKMARTAVRDLARRIVVAEKSRLEGMRRAMRRLREGV